MDQKTNPTNYAGNAIATSDVVGGVIGADPAADYETALAGLDRCYVFMQKRFGGAAQDSQAAECILLLNKSIAILRAGSWSGAGHVASAR